jgi:hypothetical protein
MIEYPIIPRYRMLGFSIALEPSIYVERLKNNCKDLAMIDELLNHFLEPSLPRLVDGPGWGRYYT